jgi:hypothetical protein
LILGNLGEGRELKRLSIWAEKEFGVPLPEKYESDSALYTHIEACALIFDGIEEMNQLTTVIHGKGYFHDYEENTTYRIKSLHLPFSKLGKHIAVENKEDTETIEWRSYHDGKIISFYSNGNIEHWK